MNRLNSIRVEPATRVTALLVGVACLAAATWSGPAALAQEASWQPEPSVSHNRSAQSPWMPDSDRLAVLTGVGRLEQRALAPGGADNWDILLAPYFLHMQVDGTLRVGEVSEPLDLPPDFFVNNNESGVSLYIEAKRFGRYGGAFDISYVKLGNSFLLEGGDRVEWEYKLINWEAFGLYRFLNAPRRSIDALGGVRYKRLDFEAKVIGAEPDEAGFDPSWYDPFVGGRWIEDVFQSLLLIFRGDVGGFGVGSDLSWQFRGGVAFTTGGFAILIEYQYLDVDYKEGSGSTAFAYDAAEKGTLLGFGFAF